MAAKKKKSTRVKRSEVVGSYSEPRSVNIKAAANGFVISTYTDTGEAVEVARTMREANRIAKRILEG